MERIARALVRGWPPYVSLLLVAALGCEDRGLKVEDVQPTETEVFSESRSGEDSEVSSSPPNTNSVETSSVVRFRLTEDIHWLPGKKGSLQVELTTKDDAGDSRVLDYEALGSANPVAEINYLDGDLNYHSLEHVELSDRPGEGVYSARFDHPDGARGADVIVRVESERDDVTVEPLEIKGIPIEFDLMFGGGRSGD